MSKVHRRATEVKTMKTLIHKKAQTASEKILNKSSFTQAEVVALLNALHPQEVNKAQATVSGIIAAAKKPVAKPSKPKQLVVKLYNAKLNKHDERIVEASDACDLKVHELITLIREEGYPADSWSFKIRIPVGL